MEKISVKGMLPLLILAEARKGASGKAVVVKASEVTRGKWKPSPGSIYPLLRAMENKGWLEHKLSEGKGRREIRYLMTKKGKEAFEKEKKRAIMEFEETFEMLAPLAMYVLHDFDGVELEQLRHMHERGKQMRKKLLAMPHSERKKTMERAAGVWEKAIQ